MNLLIQDLDLLVFEYAPVLVAHDREQDFIHEVGFRRT
jgi:hypothetical protein